MKVDIYVKPGASRTRIGGVHGDRLVVSVTASAVAGKANRAVIEVVADALSVAKRAISISSGESSKRKSLSILGDEKELSKIISNLKNSF